MHKSINTYLLATIAAAAVAILGVLGHNYYREKQAEALNQYIAGAPATFTAGDSAPASCLGPGCPPSPNAAPSKTH
jgi:hypothetical protein